LEELDVFMGVVAVDSAFLKLKSIEDLSVSGTARYQDITKDHPMTSILML